MNSSGQDAGIVFQNGARAIQKKFMTAMAVARPATGDARPRAQQGWKDERL
jgi:hypothetical protein